MTKKPTKRQLRDAARSFNSAGAARGGAARARALSSADRSAIARAAARSRWGRSDIIEITFDDRRLVRLRGVDSTSIALLRVEVRRTGEPPWRGEVLVLNRGIRDPDGIPLEVSPEAPDWIDLDALLRLGGRWWKAIAEGDSSSVEFLVRPEGDRWVEQRSDVASA